MSRKPPHERPTAEQYLREGNLCPECGGVLMVDKSIRMPTRMIRYVQCHNPKCGSKYLTRQEHPVIIREIGSSSDDEEVSTSGNADLTLACEAR